VRVLELGGGGDFLDEALRAEDRSEVGLEDLEGHLAVVLEIFGEIHRGHAALAQLALCRVAAREGRSETVRSVRHETPPIADR
jgi:hypothetical protein